MTHKRDGRWLASAPECPRGDRAKAKIAAPPTSIDEGRRTMRSALTVRETAFLLQLTEMIVRRERRLERVPGHRIMFSAASVDALLPEDGTQQLRRLALEAILNGRFQVPTPEKRWAQPAPLTAFSRRFHGV
jgi:hypothetical protein